MLRKSKLKDPRSDVKGIYLMTVVEGLYVQLLLMCVIQMVDMTTLPPVFNPTPLNVTAYVGETATLPCSISNLGSREVIWKKVKEKHALTVGEFVFVKDPSFSVKHIPYRDEWNLMINNIQLKHAGKFECQVSTKENMHRFITLTVSDKKKRIKNEPSKNYPAQSPVGKRESNIDPDNLPINEDPSKTGNHQSRNRPSHGVFVCVLLISIVLI
ncbi:leucine-rich repeat-containing protein 24-like isoform X4 [Mizuhopecten yessoensis]|uniref:leucine-rich repeat-containing protein 24-like isoform X4 n=1 Tax=Mizuhopecten yessoensis TaxID=6573 RepID=UPI000B45F5C5|nr:leucine-rich repeat-containing protein 24-like isoform X4 [Mizuhopecten yessoensis]